MRNTLGSAAVGIASFVVAMVAAYVVLLAFLLLFDGVQPSSERTREMIAYAVTATALVIAVGLVVALPIWTGGRWHTNTWIAVGLGGLLTGGALPFLVVMIAIVNGCGLHVAIPFEGPCST